MTAEQLAVELRKMLQYARIGRAIGATFNLFGIKFDRYIRAGQVAEIVKIAGCHESYAVTEIYHGMSLARYVVARP